MEVTAMERVFFGTALDEFRFSRFLTLRKVRFFGFTAWSWLIWNAFLTLLNHNQALRIKRILENLDEFWNVNWRYNRLRDEITGKDIFIQELRLKLGHLIHMVNVNLLLAITVPIFIVFFSFRLFLLAPILNLDIFIEVIESEYGILLFFLPVDRLL